jgi:hypothetical protein
MKKKISTIVFIFLIVMISIRAFSQNTGSTYRTAIGFKFYPAAVSVKHFTTSNTAIEGLGYFWNYGFRFTGLYEFHGNIGEVQGLRWYVGPGAHIGFWNDKYKTEYDEDGAYAGIDGVLGLDFKFTGAPINISLDWQPSFSFGVDGRNGFEGGWGGVGIRYTF